MKKTIFTLTGILLTMTVKCQQQPDSDSVRAARAKMVEAASRDYLNRTFTIADTLRGTITAFRRWWDVKRYDVSITPDFKHQTTSGENLITYQVVSLIQPSMQIDLQAPLVIDSVLLDNNQTLPFIHENNVWFIDLPRQYLFSVHQIRVVFHGQPVIAKQPPWDGGWTFTRDRSGSPWMTVCCQGKGASIWYPCKDHQSDEPELGASLTMTVPSSLAAISNGHKVDEKSHLNGTTTTKWAVQNPINNYCIIPYIGDYVSFSEVYQGVLGPLEIHYHVLREDQKKARTYMLAEVHHMLKSMEYWFGPYPFNRDGYQIVQVQHTGMEHQNAIAYGNRFAYGYRGKDLAGNGWGAKWDFIIVHESGHEWFGNNITSKDLADMWVHESFTNYSETLYVEYRWGKNAGNAYNFGIRRNIRNDRPITAHYGVNESGSGDMYYKGSNMIHAIRHSMDNDSVFRSMLHGLNKDFYHQTVTGQQIEAYICKYAGYNYMPVFRQYLTTMQVPRLQVHFNGDSSQIRYRWENCLKNFNLPSALRSEKNNAVFKFYPTTNWQTRPVSDAERPLIDADSIRFNYYIQTNF